MLNLWAFRAFGFYYNLPVLLQDYVQYALPLREIIALSDFEKRFDDAKLKDACDISGLSNVIMDWRDGFNSPLGTYYSDN